MSMRKQRETREREFSFLMEEYHQTTPHRRTSSSTTTVTTMTATTTASTNHQETQEENQTLIFSSLAKPMAYFLHQLEFLSSPFLSLLSKPEAIPSHVARGLLAAIHAVSILIAVLVVAVIVGVGLVRFCVEEPVAFRSPLHFDYTEEHPSAIVLFRGGKGRAVPVGHRMKVSVGFVMPESNFNQRIGVFQVTAEIMASNAATITSSSQPCMLRFRSLPIRLMRTFLLGIPLLVGMSSESQKIEFEILRYEETSHQPTEGIRVRLKPRAGTSDLPQIYEAELLMNSQLPWKKEIVYNWKWTFYVWVSLYVYTTLLIVLTCCFKPLIFFPIRNETERPVQMGANEMVTDECGGYLSHEFSEALRRWRERSRSKRKVQVSELIEESGSSVVGGESSEVIEDYGHFVASETSECMGG